MNTRRRSRWSLLAAALLALVFAVRAQPPAAASAAAQAGSAAALSQPVPTDPDISMGTFPNGMRYYVRANKKPEKRAELRLVVRAGSIFEEDDQQGLAHFVEHMCFNGTQHFPKADDVISFIQSLGMRFGNDVNAGTSFDETTFTLTVPTDQPDVMDRALLILEDWAHNVSFDPTEIDKERGVVMEEWRSRLGAGARMTDKLFPTLLKGSRYADRIPIGKPDIIQNFKPERLKAFYADWYRPDLMAVVAVGDFDKSAVNALVQKHFSTIPAKASPKPRPVFDMPDHAGTTFAILTDKEMTGTSVEVDNLLRAEPDGTLGDYRQKIVENLFGSMLNARFGELTRKPDAPFIGAGAGHGPFIIRTKDTASLFAQVKEDGIEKGLDGLYAEVARVERYGFTATELDRQRQAILRNFERQVAEKDNRVSASRADEYIRNFLFNESLPTADEEYAMQKRFLADIALDDINKLAKSWYTDNDRMVIVNAPAKAGLVVPDEAKITAAMKSGISKDVPPYVDTIAGAVLLDTPPAPGSVTKTSSNAPAGITEWELSNGVKVVLKPTTFKQDEIVFRAISNGGTSLASDADYIPATTATAVVSAGGVGKFNVTDLGKVTTGKAASVAAAIDEISEGLIGGGSPRDIETLFQLIYLRFTSPRSDPAAFASLLARQRAGMANQTASPDFTFADAFRRALYQDHPRRRLATSDLLDQWSLDKSVAFYKDRFSDASGFTFVFVGNLDPAVMKPLVERYLGGLPSTHKNEAWKDVGVHMVSGVVDKRVEKGIEPKSQAVIAFNGPFVYDQTQRVAIRAMAEVLQMRLTEVIREELGGTYGVNVGSSYYKIPRPEYIVSIQWGCDPARLDALTKRVLDEIESLKTNGPTEKHVTDERAALLKQFETDSTNNLYLRDQIIGKYQNGEDPATLWSVPDYYRKIDAAMIQQAAKTYLGQNRLTVTLVPEKK